MAAESRSGPCDKDSAPTESALPRRPSSMVARRPTRSAMAPPASEVRVPPTPKSATTRPAAAASNPRSCTRKRARKPTTKEAARLMRTPHQSTQKTVGRPPTKARVRSRSGMRRGRLYTEPGAASGLPAAPGPWVHDRCLLPLGRGAWKARLAAGLLTGGQSLGKHETVRTLAAGLFLEPSRCRSTGRTRAAMGASGPGSLPCRTCTRSRSR